MKPKRAIENSLLVLRCQQGDGEAFADLVLQWHGRLVRHAQRLTGDPEAATDVVQDSWEAVLRGLPRLSDVDAFPSWVFRIVTNKARDWVRKQQRRRHLSERLGRESERSTTWRTDDGATDKLNRALAGLSIEQRGLITLYYEEGFRQDEIGDILGIPRGTVKSRLYHAREAIRIQLEDTSHDG